MRIVINAHQFSSSITGTDRMASNFLRELQKIDKQNQYFILCSSENYIQPVITSRNFKILQPPRISRSATTQRIVNKIWRTLIDYYVWLLRADAYLSFHNMRLPKFRVAKKMIASNLDLIPLVLEEYRNLVPNQRKIFQNTVKHADQFFSISNFSKDELHRELNVSTNKIEVIHLAADTELMPQEQSSTQLPESFIFTIGGSEPRKNVETVAKAFAELPEKLQAKYPLLIVGGEWHGKPLKPLLTSPHVKLLGYVDDKTLSSLYGKSAAFVFASEYEGFGFTILEAMSMGSPVIAASGTSLDEVAGEATLKFDPHNTAELSAHMKELLKDASLQESLRKKGFEQASKFSWKESAQKLHALLIR